MKKKINDSTKKKGKKKKVVKKKEAPVWGDPDCKSFAYHPVTGKPLNPFPNLKDQESIIPFFSEQVLRKRQELEIKKKKEQEESQAGSLYRPINLTAFSIIKEESQEDKEKESEIKPKPKLIIDLHRFEWINRESWIRCRLRQKSWSYNDMFLNVQCSWTLFRLKLEIKKHLFEGSLLPDNILIYKNDLSRTDNNSDSNDDNDNNDNYENNNNNNSTLIPNASYTQGLSTDGINGNMNKSTSHVNNSIMKLNNGSTMKLNNGNMINTKNNNGSSLLNNINNDSTSFNNNINLNQNINRNNSNINTNSRSSNKSKSTLELENNNNNNDNNKDDKNNNKDEQLFFSKNQEYNVPLYKLFPRINKLKSIGNMIPFDEGYTKCDDNDYPILVVGQQPIHIYEPPLPPPPKPAFKKKVTKKKKKDGETNKKSTLPKFGAKKKKTVKKKKKTIKLPQEEEPIDVPHEPNDNEILDMMADDVEIYNEPYQILKNPDQYLYIFFDVNFPLVSV